MDKKDQLIADFSKEKAVGFLLMAQLDAVPETIQLVVAATELDESVGGLRERANYVIRAIGVVEHRLSLGQFATLRFADDHPLLYPYNDVPCGLFFRGMPDDPNALLVDILQAYATTFGPWRQIPDYLNQSKPLFNLLTSGGDLLGEMPKKLADNLVKALEAHKLETKVIEGAGLDKDEHGRSQLRKVLLLDDSYAIALDFSVDILGKA